MKNKNHSLHIDDKNKCLGKVPLPSPETYLHKTE